MKKFFLYFIMVICVLVILFAAYKSTFANSRDLDDFVKLFQKADELFEKQLYEQSVKEYEKIYNENKDSKIKNIAFYRYCESLANLGRYAESVEKLWNVKLPSDDKQKVRLLILKTEILQIFLSQYAFINTQDIIEEKEEKKDIFKYTPEEIRSEIEKNYKELWKNKNILVSMNLRKEKYYFDTEKIDFKMYPTLLDLLILRWTDYLKSLNLKENENIKLPDAELVLSEKFLIPLDFDSPRGLFIASIFETASDYHSKKNIETKERLKIQRIILPLHYQHFYSNCEYKKTREQAIKILMKWMETFKSKNAAAEAGFRTAEILNQTGKIKESVELCRKIESDFEGCFFAEKSKVLRAQIENPNLRLTTKNTLPPGKDSIIIYTKNIEKAYFRLYRIDPYDFRKDCYQSGKNNHYDSAWSRIFNQLYSDRFENYVKTRIYSIEPFKEWTYKIENAGDFQTHESLITPPALEEGIYLVLVSGDKYFKVDESIMSAGFINVSNLMILCSSGVTTNIENKYFEFITNPESGSIIRDNVIRLYAFDAKNGVPLEKTEIDAVVNSQRENFKTVDAMTNMKGIAFFKFDVDVHPDRNSYYHIDPLAKYDNSYAYLENQNYYNYSSPNPIHIFIQTDRPVYRPTQNVSVKIIAVRKTETGFKPCHRTSKIVLDVLDPNSKSFFKKELELNEFGSVSTEFKIEAGRLLGTYSISAVCYDGIFSKSSQEYIKVEEYKRPDFEVVLKTAEKPVKYNQKTDISGTAKYYFGGPVPDASVKYRIKYSRYIPWFFRYWFQNYNEYAQEFVSGETKTDSSGNFNISFVPKPFNQNYYWGSIPDVTNYIVEVDCLDAGGRTISASQNYKGGRNEFYYHIELEKDFFMTNEQPVISVKKLSLNEIPMTGKSRYEVYLLQDTVVVQPEQYNRNYYNQWIPPIDAQLKDVPNQKLIFSSEIEHLKNGIAEIKIPELAQGTYRIKVRSGKFDFSEKENSNPDDLTEDTEIIQSKIFVCAKNVNERIPIPAYSVTLSEKNEYKVGDTARFVIGSSLSKGYYFVELWAGNYLIETKTYLNPVSTRMIEIPVLPVMKGGFTLKWFGATNSIIYSGQTTVSVPYTEKKLNISFTRIDKEIVPGSECEWSLNVKDIDGEPVNAEILSFMYDRSLEYYASSNNLWIDSLYNLRTNNSRVTDSCFNPQTKSFMVKEGLFHKLMQAFRNPPEEPALPGLRMNRNWYRRRNLNLYSDSSFLVKKSKSFKIAYEEKAEKEVDSISFNFAAPASKSLLMNDSFKAIDSQVVLSGYAGDKKFDMSEKSILSEVSNIQTRMEFSESAFFKPHIVTDKNGNGSFGFKTPDQLTSWKIKAFAFTRDMKEGVLTDETESKKKLMIRADIPRFFREKDKGTITAVIHNESDTDMTGEAIIIVTENKVDVSDKIKLKDTVKKFTVKSHSLQHYNWTVEIPEGVSNYKVKVAAVSGKLKDAEERELPVLPSRERLIESVFVSLTGSVSKNLKISLKNDSTRITESMSFQLEPQIALNILNSLPFLVDYPYGCIEQTLNKFVPLAITNRIFERYPDIKKSVSKISKRDTLSPEWEKNDPRRMQSLMETPWAWQSEGRPVCWPVIDMLNPEIVEAKKNQAYERLKNAQLSSGGFPWWPGSGDADPYITLYVLAGFNEARKYGVEIDETMINNALRYVNEKIPLMLKPEERCLALVSYAAYVITSYSKSDFSGNRKGFKAAKNWVVFLENNLNRLTPLGKAYLAYTYYNLGERKK
ncbi:hypothetical protein KA977_10670, partial [Candidatus Dependentiae bacterium]|nr:hypothetical protein [Candidatus Dependentiae bacterium]